MTSWTIAVRRKNRIREHPNLQKLQIMTGILIFSFRAATLVVDDSRSAFVACQEFDLPSLSKQADVLGSFNAWRTNQPLMCYS